VVVGATGQVGRRVVNGPARAGRQVRAVPWRAGPARAGVTARPVDVRDVDAFRAVPRGAGEIFVSLPVMLATAELARIAADIAQAGTSTTVLLSSDLVQQPSRFDHGRQLRARRDSPGHCPERIVGDALRPGAFMDSDAIEWAATIRDDAVMFTAFPDALQVPIAPVDIAAEAVAALTSPGSGPHSVRRPLGPEWLSARNRVTVLTGVLNRPITIREISAEEHRALLARVLPEPIAAQKVAMLGAARRAISECPRLPDSEGRTPYSVWAAANTFAFGVGAS
jgi:uncharacterized protein YbjT (DUF2867 family)